jgi:hypothetical protein
MDPTLQGDGVHQVSLRTQPKSHPIQLRRIAGAGDVLAELERDGGLVVLARWGGDFVRVKPSE